MTEPWLRHLTRWTAAGIVDAGTADRIRAFEAQQEQRRSTRLQWPVWLALVFGAVMIGAGMLLFVSTHWAEIPRGVQFALIVALVASFHVVGALAATRFPATSATLHAAGTLALGPGILLAGEIFKLTDNWTRDWTLWALGAAIAWAALRDRWQFALVALLVPAALAATWIDATRVFWFVYQTRVLACGIFLLALAYFTAPQSGRHSPLRPILRWIGGITLMPSGLAMAIATASHGLQPRTSSPIMPVDLQLAGWLVALAAPLIVALALQRRDAWRIVVAIAWTGVLVCLGSSSEQTWPLYAWWAAGAIGLVAWGVDAASTERINMGSAALAVTIATFYFSHVMDKLGRSVSLVGLGLLFLAGGWALERTRRRLVRSAVTPLEVR